MRRERCVLCFCKKQEGKIFKNAQVTLCPTSKKPIKDVIEYLAKSAELETQLSKDSLLCLACCRKIICFDENMIKIMELKRDLLENLQMHMIYLDSDFEEELQSYALAEENYFSETMPSDNEINQTVQQILTEKIKKDNNDGQKLIINDNITIDSEPKIINEDGSSPAIESKEIAENICEKTANENGPRKKKAEGKPKFCKICRIVFSHEDYYNNHKQYHKMYRCNLCNFKSPNEFYLTLHKNKHAGKLETQCPICDKVYGRKYHAFLHWETHLDLKKYQCDKCGLRFNNFKRLKDHKLRHDAEENPLFCSICQQQFISMKTFKAHAITHRKDRPHYTCEQCGKLFAHRYTLKMHIRTNHGKESEDIQSTSICKNINNDIHCIICNDTFINKELLEKHLESHHDVILEPA